MPKNGVQHMTAIYTIPRYTRPRYIALPLISRYHCLDPTNRDISRVHSTMSASRKRVISTEEIQFNLKPTKMLLTKKRRESAKMAKPQIHGSHTFSKMKFQDFSRTYQGQNYIFKHYRIVIWCIVNVFLCDEISCHTSNFNIHHRKYGSPHQ